MIDVTPINTTDAVLRVLFAFIISIIFGLERQFSKKPVGFGAFTFVTTGAATLTVVSVIVTDNPFVIAGAIMTGIGFLGAGAIIKGGDKKVLGITTASSIWAFAGLGIICGLGLYSLALLMYLLIGVIIVIDHYFERHGFGSYSKMVSLTVNEPGKLREIEKMLPKHKAFTYSFDNNKKEHTITFLLSGNKREVNMTLNEILRQPGVIMIKVE